MPAPPNPPHRPRWRTFGVALLLALGLHGLALHGDAGPAPRALPLPAPAPGGPAAPAPMQPAAARPVLARAAFALPDRAARQDLAALSPSPAPLAPQPAPVAAPRQRARAAPLPAASPASAAPVAGPASMPAAPASAATAASAPPRAPPAALALKLPPSVQLSYRLERGLLQGEARLDWRLEGPLYQLQLEGRLPLVGTLMTQRSSGRVDAGGLLPQRFTERRLKRSERAVSFERPADGSPGRIRFSASSAEAPLRPGAQDRVSWLVQLAARAAAAGALVPGHTIDMDVAGAGGEVQAWHFVLQGQAGDGSWHWKRATDDPESTAAEVWTDPRRGHWPRRVRLAERHGEPLELRLQDGGDGTP